MVSVLNSIVPPVSPLMAMAALDLEANGELSGRLGPAEVRAALEVVGVDLTATETVRLALELVASAQVHAASSSPSARSLQQALQQQQLQLLPPSSLSWVDVLVRLAESEVPPPSGSQSPRGLGNPRGTERLMPSVVTGDLARWAAVVRENYEAYEGRQPDHEDLCEYVPFWPADGAQGTSPVLGGKLLGRLVAALDGPRATFARMLRVEDAATSTSGQHRGTVCVQSLRYSITAAAGRRHNPYLLSARQVDALARMFHGAPLPGLAARVLDAKRQVAYPALLAHVGPLLAEVHWEKLRQGLTQAEIEGDLAGDALAALCQLSAQLYAPLLGLLDALHAAAGPARRGLLQREEFFEVLSKSLGSPLDLDEKEEAIRYFRKVVGRHRYIDLHRFRVLLAVMLERAASL